MNDLKHKKIIITLASILSIILMVGCSDDKPYTDYIEYNPIEYVGKVNTTSYISGINKVQLTWKVSTDPSVSLIKISWLQDGNIVTKDIEIDTADIGNFKSVTIDNLPAGSYTFTMVSYSKNGDKSVPVELFVTVLDSSYLETIKPTLASAVYENDNLTIMWDNSAEDYGGSEFSYENINNETITITTTKEDTETVLNDYKSGTPISYFSTYSNPEVLDELNSETVKLPVKFEYPKTTWTTPTLEYDQSTSKVPSNAIDGLSNTVWRMDKSKGSYPHILTVNMGSTVSLNGMTFLQRQDNINYSLCKLTEFQTSMDGITWETQTEVELPKTQDPIIVPFGKQVSAMYFRAIFKSDYGNNHFTNVAEIGAFVYY